jgi:hypothetical protein
MQFSICLGGAGKFSLEYSNIFMGFLMIYFIPGGLLVTVGFHVKSTKVQNTRYVSIWILLGKNSIGKKSVEVF